MCFRTESRRRIWRNNPGNRNNCPYRTVQQISKKEALSETLSMYTHVSQLNLKETWTNAWSNETLISNLIFQGGIYQKIWSHKTAARVGVAGLGVCVRTGRPAAAAAAKPSVFSRSDVGRYPLAKRSVTHMNQSRLRSLVSSTKLVPRSWHT